MVSSLETLREYSKAWNREDSSKKLTALLRRVRGAIDQGESDPAHRINFGALLLDLQRNREALEWFRANPLQYKEYFQNLAIALAKTDRGNIQAVRANNKKAEQLPSCPNTIVAYIDYHGM
ncbi:MAG: hypothetical protein KDD64_08960 [Bdellovibrionales bacterium]|nr:hypothetical protein [Bdellovibrionales bacterium]